MTEVGWRIHLERAVSEGASALLPPLVSLCVNYITALTHSSSKPPHPSEFGDPRAYDVCARVYDRLGQGGECAETLRAALFSPHRGAFAVCFSFPPLPPPPDQCDCLVWQQAFGLEDEWGWYVLGSNCEEWKHGVKHSSWGWHVPGSKQCVQSASGPSPANWVNELMRMHILRHMSAPPLLYGYISPGGGVAAVWGLGGPGETLERILSGAAGTVNVARQYLQGVAHMLWVRGFMGPSDLLPSSILYNSEDGTLVFNWPRPDCWKAFLSSSAAQQSLYDISRQTLSVSDPSVHFLPREVIIASEEKKRAGFLESASYTLAATMMFIFTGRRPFYAFASRSLLVTALHAGQSTYASFAPPPPSPQLFEAYFADTPKRMRQVDEIIDARTTFSVTDILKAALDHDWTRRPSLDLLVETLFSALFYD